jgi:hypothetical protein
VDRLRPISALDTLARPPASRALDRQLAVACAEPVQALNRQLAVACLQPVRQLNRQLESSLEPVRRATDQLAATLAEPLRKLNEVTQQVHRAYDGPVRQALAQLAAVTEHIARLEPRPPSRSEAAELIRFMKGRTRVPRVGGRRRHGRRIGAMLYRLGISLLSAIVPVEEIAAFLRRLRRDAREGPPGRPWVPALVQFRVPADEVATVIMRHGPPVRLAHTCPAVASAAP